MILDVILNWNGSNGIAKYHTKCDFVIFNQNGSIRISQYHIGCDIVIFDWNTLGKTTLYLMWY